MYYEVNNYIGLTWEKKESIDTEKKAKWDVKMKKHVD
jgi:hypothetical protein